MIPYALNSHVWEGYAGGYLIIHIRSREPLLAILELPFPEVSQRDSVSGVPVDRVTLQGEVASSSGIHAEVRWTK